MRFDTHMIIREIFQPDLNYFEYIKLKSNIVFIDIDMLSFVLEKIKGYKELDDEVGIKFTKLGG